MTTLDRLRNAAVRHQVYLERLKAGTMRNYTAWLDRMGRDVVAIMRQIESPNVSDLTKRELTSMLTEMRAVQEEAYTTATAELVDELEDLAEYESAFESRTLSTAARKLKTKVPKARAAFSAALTTPMSATGELLKPFIEDLKPAKIKKLDGIVRRAWAEGRTVQQMIQEFRGTKARNFRDGVLNVDKRHAEAMVRTSVQHVANAARQQTWAENADIVVGYEWISTLDSKTTPQCRSLDGKTFPLGKGPQPPIHVNCRSTTAPALDDGLDFLDTDATRSSATGPVAADETYYDWLKKQDAAFQDEVLGKTRGKLFRDGGLTTEKFSSLQLDKNFRPLTLDEMRKLEPAAFVRAGLGSPQRVQSSGRVSAAEREVLQARVWPRPKPGGTTAKLWDLADDMTAANNGTPVDRKAFLARARELGFKEGTSKSQYGRWKTTVRTTVAPPPRPAPTPTPSPEPLVDWDRSKYPKPGTVTRKLWDMADEMTGNSLEYVSRKEFLARAKAEGFSSGTAQSQYQRWKRTRTLGKPDAPVAPKPVKSTVAPKPSKRFGIATTAKGEQRWQTLKSKLDDTLATSTVKDAKVLHAEARELWKRELLPMSREVEALRFAGRDSEAAALHKVYERRMKEEYWPRYNMSTHAARSELDRKMKRLLEVPKDRRQAVAHDFGLGDDSDAPWAEKKLRGALKDVERYTDKSITSRVQYGVRNAREADGNLGPNKMARAFFEHYAIEDDGISVGTIWVDPRDPQSTFLHELTHNFEYVDDRIARRSERFRRYRSGNRPPKRLMDLEPRANYEPDEITLEDDWKARGGDHYVGRVYNRKTIEDERDDGFNLDPTREPTEVLTMGYERFVKSPSKFYEEDPEYFEFFVRQIQDMW